MSDPNVVIVLREISNKIHGDPNSLGVLLIVLFGITWIIIVLCKMPKR